MGRRAVAGSESPIAYLESVYPRLSASHKQVCRFLMEHPTKSVELGLDELAAEAGCSRSSVIRFCKVLGLVGFKDLRRLMLQPVVRTADPFDADEVVQWCVRSTMESVQETFSGLDRDQFAQAVELCRRAASLIWYGTTESGALAECAAHKCSLLGMASHSFRDPQSFSTYSDLLSPRDVLVIISWGGDSSYVRSVYHTGSAAGMAAIGITATRYSWLTKQADVTLHAASKSVVHNEREITIRAGQEAVMNLLILKTARARGVDWQNR